MRSSRFTSISVAIIGASCITIETPGVIRSTSITSLCVVAVRCVWLAAVISAGTDWRIRAAWSAAACIHTSWSDPSLFSCVRSVGILGGSGRATVPTIFWRVVGRLSSSGCRGRIFFIIATAGIIYCSRILFSPSWSLFFLRLFILFILFFFVDVPTLLGLNTGARALYCGIFFRRFSNFGALVLITIVLITIVLLLIITCDHICKGPRLIFFIFFFPSCFTSSFQFQHSLTVCSLLLLHQFKCFIRNKTFLLLLSF